MTHTFAILVDFQDQSLADTRVASSKLLNFFVSRFGKVQCLRDLIFRRSGFLINISRQRVAISMKSGSRSRFRVTQRVTHVFSRFTILA